MMFVKVAKSSGGYLVWIVSVANLAVVGSVLVACGDMSTNFSWRNPNPTMKNLDGMISVHTRKARNVEHTLISLLKLGFKVATLGHSVSPSLRSSGLA